MGTVYVMSGMYVAVSRVEDGVLLSWWVGLFIDMRIEETLVMSWGNIT